MLIEIPDSFLEYVKKMPVQEVDKTSRMKDISPLRWIEKNKHGCVVMAMVYRAIMKRGIELGLIEFDPETKSWKGVDYDD